MSNFIDLNRSFAPVPKDHELNDDQYETYLTFGQSEIQKWSHLLQHRRVIILAEAGAGKTEEIRAATKRLRDEGKRAFFFRLEHLCSNFETSFEIGTEAEFEQWLSSDEKAWFFLDSVDEARLVAPKKFEAAIRIFGYRLGDGKQRAHIFITSRLSEWRPQSDFNLIKDQFSIVEPVIVPKEKDPDTSDFFNETSSGRNKPALKEINPLIDPIVFSLLPLEENQIRVFAREKGAQNIDAFLRAIEGAEAQIFARRPLDLDDLINYWNEHGNLANRAELIEFNISSKLKELDPDHALALPLTDEDARIGAEIIAAAVTLQKKDRIYVPDRDPDPKLKQNTIDSESVLADWHFEKIRALLQRPIFDQAIYGTVRFHHRSVREYLTGKMAA